MKKLCRKEKIENVIKTINLNAAGIDLGSRSHWVAIPKGRGEKSIREFGCYTANLEAMASWLEENEIDTIAMEATGCYWQPVYDVLESHGFDIKLVNARHMKNVAGRKTDIVDCQWLQHLHACGLLSGSFIPDSIIRELRAYVRHRNLRIIESGAHIKRIHNNLERMNIHIHKAVSDIMGQTGMSILKAIIRGERDPKVLAKMRNSRVHATEEEIELSLRGTWREENILIIRQSLDAIEFIKQQIEELDIRIEKLLKSFDTKAEEKLSDSPERKIKKKGKNAPFFDVQGLVYQILGVDLTVIDGLGPHNIMNIIAETGIDMTRWATEKHFTSWLGLAPNIRSSGGKVLSSRTKSTDNQAALQFRLAALSIMRKDSYLGAVGRSLIAKLGVKAKAITALARKIAVLFYKSIRDGMKYVDKGAKFYEEKHRAKMEKRLHANAKKMGYTLVKEEEVNDFSFGVNECQLSFVS